MWHLLSTMDGIITITPLHFTSHPTLHHPTMTSTAQLRPVRWRSVYWWKSKYHHWSDVSPIRMRLVCVPVRVCECMCACVNVFGSRQCDKSKQLLPIPILVLIELPGNSALFIPPHHTTHTLACQLLCYDETSSCLPIPFNSFPSHTFPCPFPQYLFHSFAMSFHFRSIHSIPCLL